MDARPRYSLTTGIPAVRVGWLIGQARRAATLDERGLARAVGVRRRTIRRWETAREVPCDREIEAIANACHRNLAELLPARDVVEFDAAARFLRVGGQSVSVADVRNDAVLTTYVALVREQRQLGKDDRVTFRQPDLDVLSEALDLDDDALEVRLRRIAGLDENDAAEVRRRLMRRRLAMPAVGLLAGSWGLARMAAAHTNDSVDDHPVASVPASLAAAAAAPVAGRAPALMALGDPAHTVVTTVVPALVTTAAVTIAEPIIVARPAPVAAVPAVADASTVTTSTVPDSTQPAPTEPAPTEPAPRPVAHPRPSVAVSTPVTISAPAGEPPAIGEAVEVVNVTPSNVAAPAPAPAP